MSIEQAATQADPAGRGRAAERPAVLAALIRIRLDLALMVLLFAVAIIPRAAWVAYNDRAPRGVNDPALYMIHADLIADGKGYSNLNGTSTSYYPVGFPATLGGLRKAGDIFGFGRSIFAAKMMNGMFGALTVVLIYLIASRTVNRRVGVASALLLSLFPSQVFYTGVVLSETLFTMLLALALAILLWNPWRREGMPHWQVFAVGVALSLATMTRGITLTFPLVLCVVWLLYLHSKRRALLQTVVMLAGVAVFIVPWSVRNTLVFDTLTGPSTNLGDDLCIGNYYGADGRFTLRGPCFEGYQGVSGKELEVKRNRHGVAVARRDVMDHPLRMPKLIAQKAYWLLYNDDDGLWAAESYGNDWFISRPLREILSFAANSIYYATGALAILGALAFAFARDIRRLVLLLAALYVLAIPLVFFGDPRFKFPAMPFVIVIAAATLVTLWDRRRELTEGLRA